VELRELLRPCGAQTEALTTAVTELTRLNADLVQRLARVERLLTRNSENSSNPPSRDDDPGRKPPAVKPKAAGSKRKRGKHPGAPETNLAWTDSGVYMKTCSREGCATAARIWRRPWISGSSTATGSDD
jgi:hypothetical protein